LGVGRLRKLLERHSRLALDTSVFIYQLEANTRYLGLTNSIFSWIEESNATAATSTITMTELLAQPYRDLDELRVNQIYGLLSTYPNLAWVAPNLEIADLAARLRASHRLRTPDALQAATAIYSRSTLLITNDPVFERIQTLEILVLDRLL